MLIKKIIEQNSPSKNSCVNKQFLEGLYEKRKVQKSKGKEATKKDTPN